MQSVVEKAKCKLLTKLHSSVKSAFELLDQ